MEGSLETWAVLPDQLMVRRPRKKCTLHFLTLWLFTPLAIFLAVCAKHIGMCIWAHAKRCPKVLVRRGGIAVCQIRQPVGEEGVRWGPWLGCAEPCKEEDSGLWSRNSFMLYYLDSNIARAIRW